MLPDETTVDLGPTFAWTEDLPEPMVPPPPPSPPEDGPPPAARIIEAMLFVGGAPLTVERAIKIVRGLSGEQFRDAVDQLNRDYRRQNRPYAILPSDRGYVLTLRPKYLHVGQKLFGATREARLSTAAVDVLALVAYRQPATKDEVDSLRGAESSGLLKQLLRRGLVQIDRRGEEAVYGTTPRFLELFGLLSLDDLPKTHDLGDV